MIDLNLLSFQPFLKTKREDEKRFIFCPIRKKYLVLQPEEFVRQLFIAYLVEEKKYSKSLIAVEKKIVSTQINRYDILVFDKKFLPLLAIECKAPHIDIKPSPPIDKLLEQLDGLDAEVSTPLKAGGQISNYNKTIQAPYLASTNGRSTYCWKISKENHSFEFVNNLPDAP